MPAQQPAKLKRVQLGDPIDWSDADLDNLSTVTQADIKAAEALWQRDAPRKYKSLLQAKVIEKDGTQ